MKQKTERVFTNTSPRACTEVKLIADHEREPTESFAVALVTLHMRTVTLKPQFAFVTILDDDNKGKLAQVNSSPGFTVTDTTVTDTTVTDTTVIDTTVSF